MRMYVGYVRKWCSVEGLQLVISQVGGSCNNAGLFCRVYSGFVCSRMCDVHYIYDVAVLLEGLTTSVLTDIFYSSSTLQGTTRRVSQRGRRCPDSRL